MCWDIEAVYMKIGLGTVQWGLDYGVSNTSGRTPGDEAGRILDLAYGKGVRVLDTAPVYGNSEAVIGGLLRGRSDFRIVTKTPKCAEGAAIGDSVDALEKSLRGSLRNLGVPGVYALLFHQPSDLLGPYGNALMEKAAEFKELDLVEKIGVSIYEGWEVDAVMERFHMDIVQVPVNVFDQRLLITGRLAALKNGGVELHARSVFLQGLLVMDPGSLPAGLDGARIPLQAFHQFAAGNGITPLQAALGFVTGLPEVDVVLCGVNDVSQLNSILEATYPMASDRFSHLTVSDSILLNPSKWKLTI